MTRLRLQSTTSSPSLTTIANMVAAGETTLPREAVASGQSSSSQQLRLTYFTAQSSGPITQIRTGTAATAAAATPTLIQFGIYSVAANGDLALLNSTANDTTLFAATQTIYTKALSSTFNKVAGTRYAVGLLIVSAATMPLILAGPSVSAMQSELTGVAPRLAGVVASQALLPSSVANASITNSAYLNYFNLVP